MEDNRENELLLSEFSQMEEEKVEEEKVELTKKQKEDLIIKEYIDNIERGIYKCVCCERIFTTEARLHTHVFLKLFMDFLWLLSLPIFIPVNIVLIVYNKYKEKREKNEKEYSEKVKDGIHKCVYCDKEYNSSSKLKLHHIYGYFKIGFTMLTLPVVIPYKLIQIGVKMIKNKDN